MKMRTLMVVCVAAGLSGCVEVERERTPHSSPIPDPVPPPENVQAISDSADVQDDGVERISDDGRPGWWFPEVRREGDTLVLCVETIAEGSLRDANRSAVEVATTRAEIETRRAGFSFDEDAMSIEKTWGWPLPSLPGREPGYAGYAMVAIDLSTLSASG